MSFVYNFLVDDIRDPMLLNTQSYWLMAPDPEDEWGFMFKNQRRFDQRYPMAWEKIIDDKFGQFETADGLFTFTTIYPLLKTHTSSSGSADAYSESTATLSEKSYFWKLVTHIPRKEINTQINAHLKQGAMLYGLITVIILPLIWLFSRERISRKLASKELYKKEQYLRTITSQLAEGLLVIDNDWRLLTMNSEAERLLGWNSRELIGQNINVIISEHCPEKTVDMSKCPITKAITEGVLQRLDNAPFTTKDGETLPVSFAVAPFFDGNIIQGAIITFHDITELLQYQTKLKIMATHDPLTGVKNRGEIERLLTLEIDRVKRYQRPLTILLLDIDHFKSINDTYGHQSGDVVLQNTCQNIEQQLRPNDALGRYGGEEFLIILPEISLSAATMVAERLRKSLAEMAVTTAQHVDIRFTVSIGVAAYTESTDSIERLVIVADEMLYKAKQSGRNRVMSP